MEMQLRVSLPFAGPLLMLIVTRVDICALRETRRKRGTPVPLTFYMFYNQ